MRAWEHLRDLSQLPIRGSGSEGERQAAAWLQERLAGLGYDVEVESFRMPLHTLYNGPAVVAVLLLAAVALGAKWPGVALFLAVASFVPLAGELLGAGRINFDLVLPKRSSQNVYATAPKEADGFGGRGAADESDADGVEATGAYPASTKVRDIVVVAHYDTQWGTWLFAPPFRPFLQPYFYAVYGSFVLALVAVVLRWAAPASSWTGGITAVAVVLLLLTVGFLQASYRTGRAVPGANDNGSGVAVALALAEEWAKRRDPGVRISFLFTGAEEVGLRGMHHFMKGIHRRDLAPDAAFVNLDNVGGGRLRYLLGEGMLGYQHYDADLVALARRIASEHDDEVLPLKNLLLPTDALAPAKAGYPVITFLATEADESIPHYHWHTDTFENASRQTVDQTERFLTRYIDALAEGADTKAS